MTYYRANMGIINAAFCLQGGSSATAWQAGALIPFIENPHIHICAITGTSGGAFNGGILKATFEEHGQSPEGKAEAVRRLKDAWTNHIAIPDVGAQMASWHQMMNPIGHAIAIRASRGLFTRQLQDTIFSVIPSDKVLQSPKGPALFVQTVHDESGEGRLYSGKQLTRRKILASAAITDCFHTVDGEKDGAYLGGANPPAPPSNTLKKVDCVFYFMTVAEPKNVKPQWQRDLTIDDIREGDHITEQAYGEIECLRQQGHDVFVIAPEESFSKIDKGMTGRSTIEERLKDGERLGAERNHAFMNGRLSAMTLPNTLLTPRPR